MSFNYFAIQMTFMFLLFIIFHHFLIDFFFYLIWQISFLCVFVSIYFSLSQIFFFFFLGLDPVFIYSFVNHFSFGPKWTKTDRCKLSGPKWTEMDLSESRGKEVDRMGLKWTEVNPKGLKRTKCTEFYWKRPKWTQNKNFEIKIRHRKYSPHFIYLIQRMRQRTQ